MIPMACLGGVKGKPLGIKNLNITTPEALQAFLDLLATSGVEEFEGFGFHVRFATTVFLPENRVSQDPGVVMSTPEVRPDPQSIWHAPELWPGGKPPEFPR